MQSNATSKKTGSLTSRKKGLRKWRANQKCDPFKTVLTISSRSTMCLMFVVEWLGWQVNNTKNLCLAAV